MSISQYLEELDNIRKEISRNNARNRGLRTRASILEDNIRDFLQEREQQGVKFNDKAIYLESKPSFQIKKKKDKKEDTIVMLKSMGVDNPQDAYVNLMNVQRGEQYEKSKLKITKLKN
jgi:hypothetical protein